MSIQSASQRGGPTVTDANSTVSSGAGSTSLRAAPSFAKSRGGSASGRVALRPS